MLFISQRSAFFFKYIYIYMCMKTKHSWSESSFNCFNLRVSLSLWNCFFIFCLKLILTSLSIPSCLRCSRWAVLFLFSPRAHVRFSRLYEWVSQFFHLLHVEAILCRVVLHYCVQESKYDLQMFGPNTGMYHNSVETYSCFTVTEYTALMLSYQLFAGFSAWHVIIRCFCHHFCAVVKNKDVFFYKWLLFYF